MRKKETRITFEHHEMIRVKRGKKSITRWCEKCRERVQMIPAEEAAILKGQSLRWLIRRLEAEELHFIEDPDYRLFTYLNALLTVVECSRARLIVIQVLVYCRPRV